MHRTIGYSTIAFCTLRKTSGPSNFWERRVWKSIAQTEVAAEPLRMLRPLMGSPGGIGIKKNLPEGFFLFVSPQTLAECKKQLATARLPIANGPKQIATARLRIADGPKQVATVRMQSANVPKPFATERSRSRSGAKQLGTAHSRNVQCAEPLATALSLFAHCAKQVVSATFGNAECGKALLRLRLQLSRCACFVR